MKTIFSIITLTFFSLLANAQNSKLIGSWLLSRVEVGGKIHEPYFIMEFLKDGKTVAMGREAGSWEMDGDKILMKSEMDKAFNGTNTIIKLTKDELIVTKEEAKLFYVKVNQKTINSENLGSGLIGTWRIKNQEGATQLLTFDKPDSYSYVNMTDGMTENGHGTWMYNSSEKSVIIIGRTYSIRGDNKISKLTESELVMENKEGAIYASKEVLDGKSIQRLTFTYEDIPEEPEGGYSLPWNDLYKMVEFLEPVNYLKFKSGLLIEEQQTFSFTSELVKIETNTEDQSVSFLNLVVSQGDTTQYSEIHKGEMMESGNAFFPKSEPWPYELEGIETITVPAGTFECTVVIGFEGETKLKYWMIIDKPGVYAKYITEGVSVFDELEYKVVELEEIKY